MGTKDVRAPAFVAFVTGLAAAVLQPVSASAQQPGREIATSQRACPAQLDSLATCHSGRDANGAWYLAAVPKDWNQMLVVHAHGGPRLGEPKADDPDEDLERFAVMVRKGYAWIGSTYRRGGYGVRMAAEDVDNSRALFWATFGKPRLTILHGQSYGGNVAAKLAELRSLDASGTKLYDGVLLTNGVLWGGTRAYGFRADLRAVYQYVCRNHPRADEEQYPVWQGLPRESTMSKTELEARVNQCTGAELRASERTPAQSRRLAAITGATGVGEKNLLRHLEWATFTFRDLVQLRLGGRNPFDNAARLYKGSGHDRALNRGVERFAADPAALTALRYDADLTGQIALPTLAIHWKDDPIASAEADIHYEQAIIRQGNRQLFVRLVTTDGTHSRLSDAEYVATLEALVDWIGSGTRPSRFTIRAICKDVAIAEQGHCGFQ